MKQPQQNGPPSTPTTMLPTAQQLSPPKKPPPNPTCFPRHQSHLMVSKLIPRCQTKQPWRPPTALTRTRNVRSMTVRLPRNARSANEGKRRRRKRKRRENPRAPRPPRRVTKANDYAQSLKNRIGAEGNESVCPRCNDMAANMASRFHHSSTRVCRLCLEWVLARFQLVLFWRARSTRLPVN